MSNRDLAKVLMCGMLLLASLIVSMTRGDLDAAKKAEKDFMDLYNAVMEDE